MNKWFIKGHFKNKIRAQSMFTKVCYLHSDTLFRISLGMLARKQVPMLKWHRPIQPRVLPPSIYNVFERWNGSGEEGRTWDTDNKIQVHHAIEKAIRCFLLCACPTELTFSMDYQLFLKDLNFWMVLLNSHFIVARVNWLASFYNCLQGTFLGHFIEWLPIFKILFSLFPLEDFFANIAQST